VKVLALIHEEGPCSGVFADAAAERGDEIEEWSLASGTPPPRPLDEYGAVMLFGGVVNTHEEDDNPWLRDENLLLQSLLDRGVPMLGVCLGGQLIAKAAGARVTRIPEPEIGFVPIELTPSAARDPLFGELPERLMALQWHYYGFELPAGAVPLARNDTCWQAYRLGDRTWGIQFHAETSREDWLRWIAEWDAIPGVDRTGFEPERLREQAQSHMGVWNEFGRTLSGRFLELAERAGDPYKAATTSRSAATAGRSSSRSSQTERDS
jgi:GMP synthase-like glutamine amidotransferase